jgi:thiosulfate/3-mercaptopyruvate sulfurtransferase
VSPARKAAAKASNPASAAKASKSTAPAKTTAAPWPLVDVAWLAANHDDPTVRLVHVSPDRRIYNKRHLAGAVYADLHRELALRGTAPETGDIERESLVPTREQLQVTLRAWRVGVGDRVVLYDDVGLNRHAIRGYWLLRLYGYPAADVHVLDGGIDAWMRAEQPTTKEVPEADLADGLRQPVALAERDEALITDYDAVLAWSQEAAASLAAPTRLLDVRTAAEWIGSDVRSKRGGHIPGARQRAFEDLLTPDGTFRSVDEMLSLIRGAGADPDQIRAVYCQSGVRSSLGWFVLHELAGFREVRNFAGSWEEWGNRDDSPVESP